MFFRRDFPNAAEALATTPSTASSSSTPAPSFRDLYYDEQIARAERLASAGTRLKERIASLKQMKEERKVQLDTRIRANGPKRRTAKNAHWSQKEYKPKSFVEKAKEKASRVAFAYEPPKFRRSSMRPSTIAPAVDRKPTYTDADVHGLDIDRKGKEKEKAQPKPVMSMFTRRPGVLAKSPIKDLSYKAAGLPVPKTVPPEKMVKEVNTPSNASSPPARLQSASDSAPKPPLATLSHSLHVKTVPPLIEPRPIRNIPGITRRPRPPGHTISNAGSGSEAESALSPPALSPPASTASSYAGSPPAPVYSDAQISPPSIPSFQHHQPAYSPPAISQDSLESLPMLSKRPPSASSGGPSLFIPKKRQRP